MTKKQRLKKILSVIDGYKIHKEALLQRKCRMCRLKKANIYYYENYYEILKSSKGGFSVVCSKCASRQNFSYYFKLSTQDRFFIEVYL